MSRGRLPGQSPGLVAGAVAGVSRRGSRGGRLPGCGTGFLSELIRLVSYEIERDEEMYQVSA